MFHRTADLSKMAGTTAVQLSATAHKAVWDKNLVPSLWQQHDPDQLITIRFIKHKLPEQMIQSSDIWHNVGG